MKHHIILINTINCNKKTRMLEPNMNNTTQIRTLYATNLPARPKNRESQISLIRKAILSKWELVQISKPNKNDAFLTFSTHQNAQEFLNNNIQLKIRGCEIKLQWAKKDSYYGLKLRSENLFKKVIKSKSKDNIELKREKRLARRQRYKEKRSLASS